MRSEFPDRQFVGRLQTDRFLLPVGIAGLAHQREPPPADMQNRSEGSFRTPSLSIIAIR